LTKTRSMKVIAVIVLIGMLVAIGGLFATRTAQAASNLTVYSQNFWNSGIELSTQLMNRNNDAQFGINFDFKANYKTQVALISFLLYSDEAVPDASYCLTHNGTMPQGHPERPFWSPGFATAYSQGRSSYSQTYTYTGSVSGTTHLISWIEVRSTTGAMTYCGQQVYQLSPEVPSVGIISN
jgi:hypothetical protein